MDSHSFADLLEAAAFIKRVQQQDTRIVDRVKSARRDATVAVARLSRDERRQRGLVAVVQARRNALASMTTAASSRQATLVRTRAVRTAALTATRANRHRVEARITKLEAAARAAAAASSAGPGGPWAIPWPIVQCESGGQNLPPNSAGASGYYQILPETWRLYGGKGPAAWKAPKAEQDRVAAKIWDHGRGRNAWVCAGLVD
jgi:transglycosylase-like protein